MQMYLNLSGKQFGPFSMEQIGLLLKQGRIQPSDLAWREGLASWVAVGGFFGLGTSSPIFPPPSVSPQPKQRGISISKVGAYSRSSLQKDEIPIYCTTLHWLVFLKSGLFYLFLSPFLQGSPFTGIALLMQGQTQAAISATIWSAVLAAIFFVPVYISYATSEFTVTNRRLIAKVGFIRKQTHEIFISKLESVGVEQGILGRVVDAGTVSTSGTGGTKQKFPNVRSPLKLRSAIQEIQAENEGVGAAR
jgi:membrane protein YdbS with pleckstrin-like domain